METRIKYIKKDNTWYYAIQVKRRIFWKTLKLCSTWLEVDNFFIEMKKVDDFNSKTKSLNKIVYVGWAARNVYETTGSAYSISFFDSPVHKRKHNDNEPKRIWADCNDNVVPKMEIKSKTLFGKECLEPMKLRITIEQIEE
jgi:hypothetical protein